jgi:hypothetical protein
MYMVGKRCILVGFVLFLYEEFTYVVAKIINRRHLRHANDKWIERIVELVQKNILGNCVYSCLGRDLS